MILLLSFSLSGGCRGKCQAANCAGGFSGGCVFDGEFAPQLAGKNADDVEAERFAGFVRERRGEADAVVANFHKDTGGIATTGDFNGARTIGGEAVLQRVRDQLVQDQRGGDGAIDADGEALYIQVTLD